MKHPIPFLDTVARIAVSRMKSGQDPYEIICNVLEASMLFATDCALHRVINVDLKTVEAAQAERDRISAILAHFAAADPDAAVN